MRVLIIGISGGIGQALAMLLCERSDVSEVIGTYMYNVPTFEHPKCTTHPVDITQEASVINFCGSLESVDWVVNAVGFLADAEQSPEKTINTFVAASLERSIRINTLPTLLLAKHLKPLLKKSDCPLFATVSAKVGSITDNGLGGWYSYRMSKAALNMALKTLSIEWKRSLPQCTVAALHPGTTNTELSKPFQKNVPEGKLFTPRQTAQYLLAVLDKLKPIESGKFWSWDGSELPW